MDTKMTTKWTKEASKAKYIENYISVSTPTPTETPKEKVKVNTNGTKIYEGKAIWNKELKQNEFWWDKMYIN
jgi:hypothetical protein